MKINSYYSEISTILDGKSAFFAKKNSILDLENSRRVGYSEVNEVFSLNQVEKTMRIITWSFNIAYRGRKNSLHPKVHIW